MRLQKVVGSFISLNMFLLADMLARIQNGILLRRHSVNVKRSRLCLEVLKLLYKEGFINGYSISDEDSTSFLVFPKYIDNKPVFKRFKLISLPSRRRYVSARIVSKVLVKSGFFVLSTSKNSLIATNSIGCDNTIHVGGELLFQIII